MNLAVRKESLAGAQLHATHRVLVRELSRGESLGTAALRAGIGQAAVQAAIRLPHVAAAIEAELQRVLQSEIAPAAFAFLRRVVASDKFGERVRVDAAKILLDRAGFTPIKRGEDKDIKDPDQMTTDELHRMVSQLERELSERATPITPGKPDLADLVPDLM